MATQVLCDVCGEVMPWRGCNSADSVVLDAPRDLGCDAVRIKVSVGLIVLNNDEASPDICRRCLAIIVSNALVPLILPSARSVPLLPLPPAPTLIPAEVV